MSPRSLNCVSLFSGCGGLDLGLKQAGFRLLLGVDNDPICAVSHRTNFKGSSFFEGSVLELTQRKLDELLDGNSSSVDLVAGGPPCPPYSKSRFWQPDKPRALNDPMGAETMEGYLRVLRHLRPRSFLLENVPGLAYKVHRDALDLIIRRAKRLGYSCSWRVINAADYGVPQMRERFFIVGMRDGSFEWPEPTHADPAKLSVDDDRVPWVTAGQAIKDLDTENNENDRSHVAGGRYHDLLCQVPPGDNYLFFTSKRGHPNPKFEWRSRYWSFLLKLSPDSPSWTIQATRSNNMGPFHWRSRILRIEEIMRLQSFPDHWRLAGTIEQQWRQVGNAVPPLLAKAIGMQLRRSLEASVAVEEAS